MQFHDLSFASSEKVIELSVSFHLKEPDVLSSLRFQMFSPIENHTQCSIILESMEDNEKSIKNDLQLYMLKHKNGLSYYVYN